MRTPAIGWGLAIFIAGALAGCAPAPVMEARPALYLVRDGDTRIWLFGTIHLLPPGVAWRTPAIESAIAEADTLVTEIPAQDPAEANAVLEAAMRNAGPDPILARVPQADRAGLLRGLDAADLTLAEADRLDSWAAATSIASGSARAAGASRTEGVEAALAARFAADGKRRIAFETLGQQLALFDTLPEPVQRVLLIRSLAEARDPASGYRATLAAWASGDQRRIAASFNPLFAGEPLLEERLLTGRNRRWARWIAQRMARPGNVFVAVGAGHLAGPKSVVAMIEAAGFKVTRVE